MVRKIYYSYNQIHRLCQDTAPKILHDFRPQLMIAIGGGGYVPARILRTFLKAEGGPNIPIQAVGLSLYEKLPPKPVPHPISRSPSMVDVEETAAPERAGAKVTRTQWLDLSSLELGTLIGKRILIVDEVDDTRTTLDYCVKELTKDIEEAAKKQGRPEEALSTKLGIFVLHNKDRPKKGRLPDEMMQQGGYIAAETTGDDWICYPWEAKDLDEHDRLANLPNHGADE